MSLMLINALAIILGILVGSLIVCFINFKKIFLKRVKFLKDEYNIQEPLAYSLYNVQNRDGFLSLWKNKQNIFFVLIPPIFTAIILIVTPLVLIFGTNFEMDYTDYTIYILYILSFLPGMLIVQIKIKKLMSFDKLYRNMPLNFKYNKITFKGFQKDVETVDKYLLKFYKQVKPFYNSLRFNLFTIQSNFNYYFVYLRSIGYLPNSKKILDFLSKNENIKIIVDNKKISSIEFKQVLANNFFCVFYYFNYYGCGSNFLDNFEEFESSEIIKNGYEFKEIKENDFLINGGTEALWSIDHI